jgi:hypothetical protein
VQFPRKFAICLLDFLWASITAHAQERVIVC